MADTVHSPDSRPTNIAAHATTRGSYLDWPAVISGGSCSRSGLPADQFRREPRLVADIAPTRRGRFGGVARHSGGDLVHLGHGDQLWRRRLSGGPDAEYFAYVMLRGTESFDQAATAADADAAVDMLPATEAETAGGQAADAPISAGPSARAPARTARSEAIDPTVQQQVALILFRSATNGEMAERDQSHLSRLVAANTDLDASEAQARVDEVNAEIDVARGEALEAVERARIPGVVVGFTGVVTLLISAIAAFLAAGIGGHHRDEGLGFDALMKRL